MDKDRLKKYADLIIRMGVNVQKGQPVIIGYDVENAEFARMVTESAYDAGAFEVVQHCVDQICTKINYLRADEKAFETYPEWMAQKYDYLDSKGTAYVHIGSTDPGLLQDADAGRIKKYQVASSTANKKHNNNQRANGIRWTVTGAPSKAWAMRVFPGIPAEEAVEKLWEAILDSCRMNEGPDPIEIWKRHNAKLRAREEMLNGYNFHALRFKNSIGTDVTVELPKGHIWCGGSCAAKDGVIFNANIPTEEIMTAPKRDGVNGKMVGSMPFQIRGGKLVDKFELDFKDGKVVSYKAELNQEALKDLIETDERSCYLGEVALVGASSPLAKMNLLFYDTLYDENVSTHFALGSAYPRSLKGGEYMSNDDLIAAGVNVDSLTHMDYMIGTADMNITGVLDNGIEIPVFVNGDFAD